MPMVKIFTPCALARSRGGLHVALVVFAVGDQDQRLVLALARVESLQAGVDRARQRRAAARDDADLDRAHRALERGVVDRQRRFEKGRARERRPDRCGRPAAAARRSSTASLARSRRLGFTSVASMLRDVSMATMMSMPLALHLLPVEAPLRSRQRDDEQQQRGQPQRRPPAPAAPIEIGRQARGQRRLGEVRQRRGAAAQQHDEQRADGKHGREQPEDRLGSRQSIQDVPMSAASDAAEDAEKAKRQKAKGKHRKSSPAHFAFRLCRSAFCLLSVAIMEAPATTSAPAPPRR